MKLKFQNCCWQSIDRFHNYQSPSKKSSEILTYCSQRYICCSPKRLRPFAIHSCIIVHFEFIIMYIVFSSHLSNECTDIDKMDSLLIQVLLGYLMGSLSVLQLKDALAKGEPRGKKYSLLNVPIILGETCLSENEYCKIISRINIKCISLGNVR